MPVFYGTTPEATKMENIHKKTWVTEKEQDSCSFSKYSFSHKCVSQRKSGVSFWGEGGMNCFIEN